MLRRKLSPLVTMNRKDSEPDSSEYFIRADLSGVERGPFTLDKLQDLAEFGNMTPDWLIRPEQAETWQPLRDCPELLEWVFPQKKTFQFKQFQKENDLDERHRAVDVKEIYRLHREDSEEIAEEDKKEWKGPAARQSPVAERTKRFPKQNRSRVRGPFSLGRVFRMVRWVLAIICGLLALVFLTMSGNWRLAAPFAGIAAMLVVLDVIVWIINFPEWWIARSVGVPPDFGSAEAWMQTEEWSPAAAAFLVETRKHPKVIRGYVGGISAAFAARDERKLNAFRELARKNLGSTDWNLLEGALQRKGLPPLLKRQGRQARITK